MLSRVVVIEPAFDHEVVDHEAAAAAILEAKTAVGQIVGSELEGLFVGHPIVQVLELELAAADVGDAHAVIVARLIFARAQLARRLGVLARIVEMHHRAAGRIAIDEQIAAGGLVAVVEIVQREEVGDALGRAARSTRLVGHEIEGDLDPLPLGVGRPVEGLLRREPAIARGAAFEDFERAAVAQRGRRWAASSSTGGVPPGTSSPGAV